MRKKCREEKHIAWEGKGAPKEGKHSIKQNFWFEIREGKRRRKWKEISLQKEKNYGRQTGQISEVV